MNSYFNINRWFFYFVKELYEFFTRYAFILLALFVLSFVGLYKSGISEEMFYKAYMFLVVYMGGSAVASVMFFSAKQRPNNIFYLTTPVSIYERFSVALTLVYIVYPLMMMVWLFLCSLVIKMIGNEGFKLFTIDLLIKSLQPKELGQLLFAFSMYMCASLFLKKQVFVKVFVGYFLVKGLFGLLMLKFGDQLEPVQNLFTENIWGKVAIMFIFWVVAFLKLKNTKL